MSVMHRVRPTPPHPPGWLVGQLPVGMRDDDLLVRFTTIFEQLGTSLRSGADSVEHVANPRLAPQAMLGYLAGWLGHDMLDGRLEVERERRILYALGQALPLRGTVAGLALVLEAVTHGRVEILEDGGIFRDGDERPTVRGVRVVLDDTGHLLEHQLRALVRDEVPAHLPVEVVFRGREDDDA